MINVEIPPWTHEKKSNSFLISFNFNLHRKFVVQSKDIAVYNFNDTLKHHTTVPKRNFLFDIDNCLYCNE